MAQKLNPFSGIPFVDANGDPRTGAKLFIYKAGSSTKQTTTKDLAGLSNHTNPIIVNSAGQIADGSGVAQAIWQPEGQDIKLVLAPSDDTDPPVAAIDTWDNIAGVNDTTTSISEWISAQTPTFVSTTTFTLAGDHTTDYHFGRRVKLSQTSGTEYATIVTSVFTSLTTVTVIVDGGVSVDSGLTQVDLGLITATNESIPNATSLTQRWAKGTDIASATALPDSTDGNYADVTGTTTITSILTTGKIGTVIKRHFDGALTLTHHATDLILPGGANITTAAGDEAEFVEYASGDFRCTSYSRADGTAVVNSIFASSAEVKTGTEAAKAIAPDTAGDHQSACKAWVNFQGTGTVTIRDSFNVDSITDNGTGNYTVNFATDFSSINYAPSVVSGTNGQISNYIAATPGVGSINFGCFNPHTSVLVDQAFVCVTVFGDT